VLTLRDDDGTSDVSVDEGKVENYSAAGGRVRSALEPLWALRRAPAMEGPGPAGDLPALRTESRPAGRSAHGAVACCEGQF